MAQHPIPPANEITPVEQVPFDIGLRTADEVPIKWSRAALDAWIGAAVDRAVARYVREVVAEALHRHKMYGGD